MTGDNGMKIEFSEKAEPKELSFEEATGVLADRDGEVWIVDDEDGVVLYVNANANELTHYTIHQRYNAFKKYGPFTKYNGVVTISN
jgi:hypothetical protein